MHNSMDVSRNIEQKKLDTIHTIQFNARKLKGQAK